MENLANIQRLKYCGKLTGMSSSCPNVATKQVKLCNKKDLQKFIKLKYEMDYRCDEHEKTGTVSKSVYEIRDLDQCFELQIINNFLKTILGKKIISSYHRNSKGKHTELTVKYLKENGAVMCFDERRKSWEYVYYHQIKMILN